MYTMDKVIFRPGSLDDYDGDIQRQGFAMKEYKSRVTEATGLTSLEIHEAGPEVVTRLIGEAGFILASFDNKQKQDEEIAKQLAFAKRYMLTYDIPEQSVED